jgi:hypothetical protein
MFRRQKEKGKGLESWVVEILGKDNSVHFRQ